MFECDKEKPFTEKDISDLSGYVAIVTGGKKQNNAHNHEITAEESHARQRWNWIRDIQAARHKECARLHCRSIRGTCEKCHRADGTRDWKVAGSAFPPLRSPRPKVSQRMLQYLFAEGKSLGYLDP
jgi:hypothetical protein